MAAGEGEGEDWQAFLNLGDAEEEEAPPALAAQPVLVEDDDDLPPPAHGGIGVPPALPVLPQGEVLGMIGELVDPVGPAAAHGADPPVHGADGGPALVLLPQQQQGVPPIGEMLAVQPAVVMLFQDEPVVEQDEQALAFGDNMLGQHGPVAADDGADLPVDGVPAPPLAPPPPPQQQPDPVVLIDDIREEDLDDARQIWDEKQQALKRKQNELLGPAPAKRPAMAMDMFAPPPAPGGGGGSVVPISPMLPGFMNSPLVQHPLPPQVPLLGPGIGGIMHSAMPSMGYLLPPAPAGMGMQDVVLPNFGMKGDARKICKACPPGQGRIQHKSKVCRDTKPPNVLSQHYCLCEPCQDLPLMVSLQLRYNHCEDCHAWFHRNPGQGPP